MWKPDVHLSFSPYENWKMRSLGNCDAIRLVLILYS